MYIIVEDIGLYSSDEKTLKINTVAPNRCDAITGFLCINRRLGLFLPWKMC